MLTTQESDLPPTLARYLHIAQELEAEIRNLSANVLLPTEEQFARRFGVSRVTIRRSLDLLEKSGLIRREQGRGTLVCPPRFVRHLVPPCSIEQDFRNQGFQLVTTVTAFECDGKAPDTVHDILLLGTHQKVAMLGLIRSVGIETLVFERRYFPASLSKGLDLDLLGTVSLSELLQDAAGTSIVRSDIETEISPCGVAVAEQLKVSVGTLVATQRFKEYRADGRPLQCGEMHYRTDRIRFSIVQKEAPFSRD